MKATIQTVCFFLLFFFLFLVCPSSCTSEAAEDRLAYASKSFDARLCGRIDGLWIEGILRHRVSEDGEATEDVFRIESPLTLHALTVSLDENRTVSVRLGDAVAADESLSRLSYLFLPVVETGIPYSVGREASGEVTVRVCNSDGDLNYVFATGKALPSRIFGTYREGSIEVSIDEISVADEEKK